MRIDEKIEIHNELNPLLFKNGTLIKEVRNKILKITKEFLTGLEDEELQTQVIDIRIVGSNASYNYTDTSDLDVHIELQVSNLDNPLLYYKLYTAYKSIFNNKYDLTIKGIPVEIYVDFEGTLPTSNGIYSVMKDEWIKEPVKSIIPEIEDEEFNNKLKIWEKRYQEIVDKVKNELNISLEESLKEEPFEDLFLKALKKRNNINIDAGDVEAGIATFNKGVGSFSESLEDEEENNCLLEVESFINNIYQVRKNSIAKDGEYGIGNLIFKQFRAMGYLKNLRELRRKLKEKELSLEGYSLNEELLNEAKIDLERFADKFGEKSLNDFTKYKQRIKNAGILTDYVWHAKHTSVKDMERMLYNIARGRPVDAETVQNVNEEGRSTTEAFNKTVRGDFEYLGNSGGYDIYWVKDYKASIDLGVNAGWCTSGRYNGGAGNPAFIPNEDSAREHFTQLANRDIHLYHYLDPETHYAKYALIVYNTSSKDVTSYLQGVKGYEDVVIVKTNCEVYDYRDKLAYDALDELPVDLLLLKPQVSIIRQSDFNEDGLYIEGETLIKVNPTIDIETFFNDDIKFIEEFTFYYCKGLKEISLPNVEKIGKYAFAGCESLEKISLPNVEKIGKYAFYGCESLEKISLPNIKEIEEGVFADCRSLEQVSLPNVEKIGEFAFRNCESLEQISLPNVEKIEEFTFYYCKCLKEISLPNVEKIGGHAFADCRSLEQVSLPNVKEIGKSAFRNCESLEQISLPNVEKIGEFTFSDCKGLKEISLPNVEKIVKYAFYGCESLEKIYTLSGNTAVIDFFSDDYFRDVEVIFIDGKEERKLEGYSLNEELLNEAKIDLERFANKFGEETLNKFRSSSMTMRLKNAEITTDIIYHWKHTTPERMHQMIWNLERGRDIDAEAPKNIDNKTLEDEEKAKKELEALNKSIKGDFKYLGRGKNKDNSNSKEYDIYQINDYIASMSLGVNTSWCTAGRATRGGGYGRPGFRPDPEGAKTHFNSYNSHSNFYYLLDTVTHYAEYALVVPRQERPNTIDLLDHKNDPEIRKAIPDIDDYKKLTVSCWCYNAEDNLDYAFIVNLPLHLIPQQITITAEKYDWDNVKLRIENGMLYGIEGDIKELRSDEITSIMEYNFSDPNCKYLQVIDLPNVEEIKDRIFYNMPNLREINLPKVKEIGKNAFSYCENLEKVNIPQVEVIGKGAFYSCKNLKEINCPNLTTLEGSYTFVGCENLTTVNLPNITTIPVGIFINCSNIEYLNIPNVTRIENIAFAGKTNNKEVRINIKDDRMKKLLRRDFPNAIFEGEQITERLKPSYNGSRYIKER